MFACTLERVRRNPSSFNPVKALVAFMLCTFCVVAAAEEIQTPISSDRYIWVNLPAGGIAGGKSVGGVFGSIAIAVGSPSDVVALRSEFIDDIIGQMFCGSSKSKACRLSTMESIGLYYGLRKSCLIASMGLSLVRGDNIGSNYRSFETLGLGGTLECFTNRFNYIGFGVSVNGNLNPEQSYAGFGFSMYFGRWRD